MRGGISWKIYKRGGGQNLCNKCGGGKLLLILFIKMFLTSSKLAAFHTTVFKEHKKFISFHFDREMLVISRMEKGFISIQKMWRVAINVEAGTISREK